MMIAAIFEVCPKADRKRHYLKIAADLKPLLEKVTMSALPPKRTCAVHYAMSALCQQRTSAKFQSVTEVQFEA